MYMTSIEGTGIIPRFQVNLLPDIIIIEFCTKDRHHYFVRHMQGDFCIPVQL